MSKIVVMVFGVVVGALSAWGLFKPSRLVQMVKGVMENDSGIYVAVIVRIVLGVALIAAAAASRFPNVFAVLGWITIAAAVGLVIIGRARMRRFVAWFDRLSPAFVRLWLLFGLAFGGLLIYGVS